MSRFVSIAGTLYDGAQANSVLTLKAAQEQLWSLARAYVIAREAGTARLAGIYQREAQSLTVAITEAWNYRRAAGWDRPHEADRVRA